MSVVGGNAIEHVAALVGMVADLQLLNTVSKLNESTTVTIPFGHGVVSDGDDGAALPGLGSVAADFIGIAMRELNRAIQDGDDIGAIPLRDLSVVTHGVVWVTANLAVTKDDPVWFIVSDGNGSNQGEFSNVVGAVATLAVLIPNAKWVSSAGAGDLAKISLGLGG